MKLQQEQNNHKMNQMMEMMKIQKQSETEIKCPKQEKEEKLKHFLNRLKRRNEIEKGKGKYLLLLESLQVSGRKREKQRIELEVQNEKLDPEDENVIPNGMENFRNGLGKLSTQGRVLGLLPELVPVQPISHSIVSRHPYHP